MFQRVFWIECGGPGRLEILSRPAAEQLEEEIAAWRDAGVTIVTSFLEREEQRAIVSSAARKLGQDR